MMPSVLLQGRDEDGNQLVQQYVTIDKLPPSVNGLFDNKARGGRRKSDRYKAWLNDAGWQLEKQRPLAMIGTCYVMVRAVKPDKRKRDVDNIVKPILDLLVEHRVIEDDSHVQFVSSMWTSKDLSGVSISLVGTLSGKPRK